MSAPSIQILDAGGPGVPRRGRVTATYQYGGDDDGSGSTISVTVTDKDGGAAGDDLDLVWDFGDGNVASALSLVNAPAADPLPSPTVQRCDCGAEQSHRALGRSAARHVAELRQRCQRSRRARGHDR